MSQLYALIHAHTCTAAAIAGGEYSYMHIALSMWKTYIILSTHTSAI